MRISGAAAQMCGRMATRVGVSVLAVLAGAAGLLARAPEEAVGGEANSEAAGFVVGKLS